MAKMCNCKRGFIQPGRCCCIECDRDRMYDEYYIPAEEIIQYSNATEPIRQPARKHTNWQYNQGKGKRNGTS